MSVARKPAKLTELKKTQHNRQMKSSDQTALKQTELIRKPSLRPVTLSIMVAAPRKLNRVKIKNEFKDLELKPAKIAINLNTQLTTTRNAAKKTQETPLVTANPIDTSAEDRVKKMCEIIKEVLRVAQGRCKDLVQLKQCYISNVRPTQELVEKVRDNELHRINIENNLIYKLQGF
jgi:hypothetical protein